MSRYLQAQLQAQESIQAPLLYRCEHEFYQQDTAGEIFIYSSNLNLKIDLSSVFTDGGARVPATNVCVPSRHHNPLTSHFFRSPNDRE
jgi:hypothetical protein